MKKTCCRLRHFSVIVFLIALVGCGWTGIAAALRFTLPSNGDNVVGSVQWVQTRPGDNFNLIMRRYDIGYFQLIEANPGINPDNIPPGTIVVIPSRFVIPPVPHKGIVLSLAELRLYYFSPDNHTLYVYPVGIGRQGWMTPPGTTKVVEKTVNPVWVVPESIKKDRAKDGVALPGSVQPGPENPLGFYRMRLGIQNLTYLIHGTNDYTGVGRRSSSGCVRMLPEDVEALFPQVSVGTPVTILNSPYKVGKFKNKFYLEAHEPLQEEKSNGEADLVAMKHCVNTALKPYSGTVYWDKANQVAKRSNGTPQVIGRIKETS